MKNTIILNQNNYFCQSPKIYWMSHYVLIRWRKKWMKLLIRAKEEVTALHPLQLNQHTPKWIGSECEEPRSVGFFYRQTKWATSFMNCEKKTVRGKKGTHVRSISCPRKKLTLSFLTYLSGRQALPRFPWRGSQSPRGWVERPQPFWRGRGARVATMERFVCPTWRTDATRREL